MALTSASPAPRLPGAIWALGFVSLLMDTSSEMVHSLLPLFLVGSLGVGTLTVGVIEGLAESTAMIVKVFSGALSDRLGRRKGLALAGYGLGAASKPLFALASGAGLVVFARLLDRVGKGIRGAPRDALVADLVAPAQRGAAYGLRQALDSVGALAGPLAAIGLMLLWAGDFRAVFWVAVVPAVSCVALLALGVHEPARPPRTGGASRAPPDRRWAGAGRLGGAYWWVTAVGTVFTLARFSEAFLVLRGEQAGLGAALAPLVMVVMSAVYAGSAYPLGRLSDSVSHGRLLASGLAVLLAADAVLAWAPGPAAVLAGSALWGLHMGMTQGLLSRMVADAAPADLRGTAFGIFNLGCGLALLPASAFAGWLWDRFGAPAPFVAGAGFCALALLVLAAMPPTGGAVTQRL